MCQGEDSKRNKAQVVQLSFQDGGSFLSGLPPVLQGFLMTSPGWSMMWAPSKKGKGSQRY